MFCLMFDVCSTAGLLVCLQRGYPLFLRCFEVFFSLLLWQLKRFEYLVSAALNLMHSFDLDMGLLFLF